VTPPATCAPLVSIITPTLNQGLFIADTIESVKSQSYRNFEHIVVDAGSRDGTLEILRCHEGTYPMKWTSQPDGGMYDGVNRGLRQAKGEVLAYLNSDDLYFPWTIETVMRAFSDHPEVDVVFGDALGIWDDSGIEDIRFQPDLGYAFLLRAGSFVQPTVFWRRRVLERIGEFDSRLHHAGDLEYWLRMGPACRMLRVDEFLAIERDHATAKRFADSDGAAREVRQIRAAIDAAPAWRQLLGRFRGRLRGWVARRVLWMRLALASRSAERGLARPWGRFLSASRLSLPARRVVLTQVPWLGPRVAPGSIRSGVDWLHHDRSD